jgi:hypothetical protein
LRSHQRIDVNGAKPDIRGFAPFPHRTWHTFWHTSSDNWFRHGCCQATVTALAGYLIHMNLSGMTPTVTLGSFVGGLIIWTLGTAIVFGSAAAIYNRLVARVRAPHPVATGRPLTQGAQF